MDSQLKKRLGEWLVWYNWNHAQLRNAGLEQKVGFLDKCVQGLFELVVKVAEEGERIDLNRDKPQIILSTGIKFSDPIREKDAA